MEVEAANYVANKWLNVTMGDIFKNWPLSVIDGLFKQSGLFDTSPERKFLEDIALDHPIARHFTIGMSDAQNGGEYVASDATLHIAKEFVDYILASSAIPVVFPAQKIGDNVYFDGMVIADLDVLSPIKRCKELGFNEKDIVIDLSLIHI